MKRILLATAVVAVVAAFAATIGSARPTATTGVATRRPRRRRRCRSCRPNIKARQAVDRRRQVRRAAVRLHQRAGQERGLRRRDRAVVRPLRVRPREPRSRSSARRRRAREPLLTADRVDLVISTFTYTADRDTRIDFSRAYYKATGRLLVKNDSPIQRSPTSPGAKVSTTSGSVYDRWVRNCFTNTEPVVRTASRTRCWPSTRAGRTRVMCDDTVLVGVAAADRSAKLTNDTFLALPYGIGIKQGNTALKRWVDSRLELMRKKDRSCRSSGTTCRAAVRGRLLEEHPPAEQHVRLRPGGQPERGHRLLAA